MISIVIPTRNDTQNLLKTLTGLNVYKDDRFEVVIVNDGTVYPSNKPHSFLREELLIVDLPQVKVVNYHPSFGVGHAFDRGVENCRYENIILMGCDVTPLGDWYEQVLEAVTENPNTLGCAVCVGSESGRKHYGADLLFWVDNDDLPESSPLKDSKDYTALFKGKWLPAKEKNTPYEIPCLMGAFYWTSKSYYNLLGGWDTKIEDKYCGHRVWGHLEPFISLKSWLVGGGCTLYPNIEASHEFGRINRKTKWSKGARSAEWTWWNALWILETMILDEFQRQSLYDFVKPCLNFNVARKMIRQNKDKVIAVREANALKFKNTLDIFTEKFDYDFVI